MSDLALCEKMAYLQLRDSAGFAPDFPQLSSVICLSISWYGITGKKSSIVRIETGIVTLIWNEKSRKIKGNRLF
jgi:hypothetical protein